MKLNESIWVEKYRPKTLADVINLPDGLAKLVSNTTQLPSMIFHGSAGVGKTSTALVIANELGCDYIKMNSSDERGIDAIREQVKQFAITMSSNDRQKLVILDESDALTKASQEALRGMIEEYSSNCFFIFTCNDFSKMIEPIVSRCLAFRFGSPSRDAIFQRLNAICAKENLDMTSSDCYTLIDGRYPDIRAMVKSLQIYAISGRLGVSSESDYERVWGLIRALKYRDLYAEVTSGGLDVSGFNRWLLEYFMSNADKYPNHVLADIAVYLADLERSLAIGVSSEIVAMGAYMQISKVL